MADIDRTVTVTLEPHELREAVALYVERINGGDMPSFPHDNCTFFFQADGPESPLNGDVGVVIISE